MKRKLLVILLLAQCFCWLLYTGDWARPAPTATGSFVVNPTISHRPLTPDERKALHQRYAHIFTTSQDTLASIEDRPGGEAVVRFSATGQQIPSLLYFLSEEVYRCQLGEQARLAASQDYAVNSPGSGPLQISSSSPLATVVRFVGLCTAIVALNLAVAVLRPAKASSPPAAKGDPAAH